MPPKKKGKKGKGASLIDGVDTSAMSREQLEAFAHRLKAEMEREREERNFFQLERDKLRTFWEITRDQLDEARATIRNKDREVEVAQEVADVDIKHVVQQMKHLQYENKTKIGEIRAEAMTQLKLAQEDHAMQELELLKDKRELKRLVRERDEGTELQLQQLKMHHSEALCETLRRFEGEAKEINSVFDQKLTQQKEDIGIKNRMEMFEVEERKKLQIQKLIESHDAAFNDMKNYYNDITLNNLALISSLKDQMEELRKQSERSERIATETAADNKKLTEPLIQARSELIDLRRKLEHYNRDRNQLTRLKAKYTTAEKQLNSLKWETEALLMRNETLVEERENLKGKFEEAVMELQQKTGLKNVLLERKVAVLEREAERREALLNEAALVTPSDGGGGGGGGGGETPSNRLLSGMRIEQLLQTKNDTIQDLRYELARVCKAHDDLLATYEAKLLQYGIPKEELGFEPLRTTAHVKYGTGPAGLVTKNL